MNRRAAFYELYAAGNGEAHAEAVYVLDCGFGPAIWTHAQGLQLPLPHSLPDEGR